MFRFPGLRKRRESCTAIGFVFLSNTDPLRWALCSYEAKTRSGGKEGRHHGEPPKKPPLPYHSGQGIPPAAFRCLSSAGGGPGSPEAPGPVKGAPFSGVSHAPTGRRRHPRYTGPNPPVSLAADSPL